MDGRITAGSNDWAQSIQKDRLHADYLRYAEGQRIMRRLSPTVLGRFLSRVMPGEFPRGVQRMTEVERDDGRGGVTMSRERAYFYDLPDLTDCRAEWDHRYGGPYAWPRDEGGAGGGRAPRVNGHSPDPY